MKSKPKGWRREPERHGLAAKGIKTKKMSDSSINRLAERLASKIESERKGRKKQPSAIGMRRAKSQGMWLWHSREGGRLYQIPGERSYYFCATCDVEGRDPYVGSGGTSVSATWTNVSPGAVDEEE